MPSRKTAIVTGSTSGIGLAIAHALAAEGCNIVVNSFSDAADDQAITDAIAKHHGVKTAYIKADMSKPAECRALVAKAAETFGSVDILVNNAGIQHVASVEEFP
ncbi:MAG: SDR family NAD(P)-dependent oxidoreductase, partial [Mesorhizobium sp.]